MAFSGRLVLLLAASVLCVMGGEAKGLPEDKVLELLEKALNRPQENRRTNSIIKVEPKV